MFGDKVVLITALVPPLRTVSVIALLITLIAGSNHLEVAVAVATTVFGLSSGAVLATVVDVLTEVPFMLFLVWLCRKTRGFF
jgi:ACR3 family arsenite efflux pump ArsB